MEARKEVWSFFSGAMGLDLGFEQAGLEPSLCVELDRACAQTARLNRPHLDFMEADVTKVSGESLRQRREFEGEVFATIGGPPCQSFSPGGKRAALADARGNLIYEYLRLIDEIQPRYFVLENVANLTTAALRHRPIAERPGKHWSLKRYDKDGTGDSDDAAPLELDERGSSALRQMLSDFHQLGYGVSFGVLDAADFGAPQHRLRFVMLGSRHGASPPLPIPLFGEADGLPPFRTVRDAIERLRDNPGPHSNYTETVRSFFAQVPEGGNLAVIATRSPTGCDGRIL